MVVLDKIKLWRIPLVVRDRVDFHDQDPLLIPLRFLFHNYCRNPCPHHLWFCDTDHANCSTGSVAHGFNSYRSEKTQWLKRILHPAAQNKHRGEATAKQPRRQEPCGQNKLNSFDTRGSKAPQWLERILPSTGQKRHSGESTAKISRQQGTLRHRLSDRLWLSEKLTHRRPRFSAPLLENEPVPRS